MSHQNGLSNNGTETTGLTEPDDSDDSVQKESENVAHARMVSNGRSSRIQDACGIRLPQVSPGWIALFHLDNRSDQIRCWPLRTGLRFLSGRKQQMILALHQHTVKVQ